MEIHLKGNNITLDPRLDRVPEFDEKSRNFPVRQLVAAKAPRSYTWRCDTYLDQGREGACVGFAWSHELSARPKVFEGLTNQFAQEIYRSAQRVDEWPGEAYDGTSVLAGVKVLAERGYISSYRWAFGLDDLILAVGHAGPAVIGINWYTGMFNPDEKGFIHPTGTLAGGHAILVKGINVKSRYFKLHNSWGQDWGRNAECYLSFADMGKLLAEQGEACIPIQREFQA